MNMREQVKRLWKLCFHDTDDFVDLYFRMRYTDEINSAVEVDGQVVSALQRIPYPMTFLGTTVPTAYVSGACTHPAYRGRGIMRRLLDEAHRKMFNQGVCFSTLIPAEESLIAYYARSGYTVCFRQQEKLLTAGELPVDNSNHILEIKKIDLFKSLPERIVSFACEQLSRQSCCILHTPADWQVIVADHRLDGGDLWVMEDSGRVRALVLCKFDEDRLTVKELLADTEEAACFLERSLLRQYGVSALIRVLPAGPDEGYALGMLRLIQVEEVLRLYAARYPELSWALEVTGDEAIPENNGCYLLEHGTCRKMQVEGRVYERCTLAVLAGRLLAGERPVMNLMLN